jgi:hypothetical protein
VFLGLSLSGHAQDRWGIQGQYITLNGQPTFLTGANYIPSTGWLLILENWNPEAIERDMAALHKLGITSLRFPPLWPLLQPNIDEVSKEKLDRVDQLVTIAHRNGIAVQVGPITGWMSGATFLPEWADGNIFTDPRIVQGEQKLATEIARRLKDNPGLQGYDFGNEVSAMASMMNLHPTPQQTSQWMETIYQAFRKGDPHHPVTDGLGGFGGSFDIWSTSAAADYMPVHSYAFFNGTLNQDPWIGQRTTYSTNYAIAYAAMAGKPVLVQEIGCSEAWVPKDEIAKFLRLTLMSSWAQGATGYFWWGSHNIDRNYHVPTQFIDLKYSQPSFATGNFANLEYSMGLLDTHNRPKPYALEYQHWIAVINQLGLGWKSDLPICYLLYPEHTEDRYGGTSEETAFTLAKQIHMEVKMWPEWKPIPSDAAALVIPDFGLSEKGKSEVRTYLEKGGVVYQSWACDFPESLEVKDSGTTLASPTFIASQADGQFSEAERIRVNAKLKLVDVSAAPNQKTQVLFGLPATGSGEALRAVFFKTSVGNGTYYYFAANLEEALSETYNPWNEDDSNLIYSVLRPESSINIDSKYVELSVKSRGREQLLLLMNHSNRFQDVTLRSTKQIWIQDYTTHVPLGEGKEIPLRLMPGEVLIAQRMGNR